MQESCLGKLSLTTLTLVVCALTVYHYSLNRPVDLQSKRVPHSDSSWVNLRIEDDSNFCSFQDLYPRNYISYKAENPPIIDGNLDDEAWQEVGWSEPFVDILGSAGPVPRFETQMKIRWDDEFLYIAGSLQDPDIWANVTKHDDVIYHDNDFEAS